MREVVGNGWGRRRIHGAHARGTCIKCECRGLACDGVFKRIETYDKENLVGTGFGEAVVC